MRFPFIASSGGKVPVLASLCLVSAVAVSGCGKAKQDEFHAYGSRDAAKPADSSAATEVQKPSTDAADPVAHPEVRVADASGEKGSATGLSKDRPEVASNDRTAAGEGQPSISREQPRRVSPERVDLTGRFANEPAVAETPPRPIEVLVPEKSFKTEKGALRVSFDDIDLLKVLGIDNGVPVPSEAVDKMPSWLKGLDGQRIRLQGFMYPQFSDTDIPRFVFTRDTGVCCFGPNPTLYYLIDVHMKDGTTADYIENRRFEVVGTFRIRPSGDGKTLDELYRIDDAEIKTR
jgi:hypothetical protein